jgi:hypothetical protein
MLALFKNTVEIIFFLNLNIFIKMYLRVWSLHDFEKKIIFYFFNIFMFILKIKFKK